MRWVVVVAVAVSWVCILDSLVEDDWVPFRVVSLLFALDVVVFGCLSSFIRFCEPVSKRQKVK